MYMYIYIVLGLCKGVYVYMCVYTCVYKYIVLTLCAFHHICIYADSLCRVSMQHLRVCLRQCLCLCLCVYGHGFILRSHVITQEIYVHTHTEGCCASNCRPICAKLRRFAPKTSLLLALQLPAMRRANPPLKKKVTLTPARPRRRSRHLLNKRCPPPRARARAPRLYVGVCVCVCVCV